MQLHNDVCHLIQLYVSRYRIKQSHREYYDKYLYFEGDDELREGLVFKNTFMLAFNYREGKWHSPSICYFDRETAYELPANW